MDSSDSVMTFGNKSSENDDLPDVTHNALPASAGVNMTSETDVSEAQEFGSTSVLSLPGRIGGYGPKRKDSRLGN